MRTGAVIACSVDQPLFSRHPFAVSAYISITQLGTVFQETLEHFEGGVNTAAPADLLPDNVSPRALNSVLAQTSSGVSVVAKRPGWAAAHNNTTSSNAIIGQFGFRHRIGASATEQFHIVIDAVGRLYKLLSGSTLSLIATPFTSGFYVPNAATMNNFLHIVNGQDRVVFNGTIAYPSGIVAPAAPSLLATGVGVMNGVYDVAITYFDSASQLESSLSPFTTSTTLVNQQLQVTWVAYAGTHPWTATRVYIRKPVLGSGFFLAATIAQPTVTTTLNLSDAAIGNLIITAPDVAENNPIPVNVIDVVAHVSRLFACDLRQVYYSNLNQPEAFDPDSLFTTNTDDGKPLTAIHSAHEVLIVWKRDSMWALYGEDPSTWVVRLVSPDVGCLAKHSVITIEGTTYWWSEQGAMAWSGDGAPYPIARDKLRPSIGPDVLSFPALDPTPAENFVGPQAAVDVIDQRVIWAVPTINSAVNDLIFSYHYALGSWETSGWTSIDAASLASIEDSNSIPQVYLGSYFGQVFQSNQTALSDGHISGSNIGTVTATSPTTVSDSAATFLTSGYGLKGRYIYIYNSDGSVFARARITANTGTQVTATFSTLPSLGQSYGIGAIDFSYDTGWRTFGLPFLKKRYEYGYFLLGSNTNSTDVYIDIFTDYNAVSPVKTYRVTTTTSGLVWDVGSWDIGTWDAGGLNRARKRLATTGFVYRFRVRHALPGADLTVLKMGVRAEALTDKN